MAEQPTSKETPDNAGELRHKLIKRLAVAGALVAVLLGVLAFFDYLSTPPEEPDEEVYTRPVPVPPKKPVSQPVTPTTELPEPPAAAQTPPPAPQAAAQPPAVAPSESKAEARPEARSPAVPPAPPVAKPPAAVPATAPAAVPPVAAPRAARSLPEASAPPSVAAPAEPAPPARMPARVVESRGVPVAEPSGIARLFSGFLLQAGVFTSQQRAEELHARLTLSGLPSTLETRVQVGPFRTRQEAEAAQLKLRELGIDTVLVPPRKH